MRSHQRKNLRTTIRQNLPYELIDGNMSHFPYGYCNNYKGFLTYNLTIIHRCEKKKCPKFETFDINKVLL